MQCTVCLKTTSPMFLAITRKSIVANLILFGRNSSEKVSNQKMLYFSTSLINASALPCETLNMENLCFHVNASCRFANRHRSHIRIII